MTADSKLVLFIQSILESAMKKFGEKPVEAPNTKDMYTETHYALTAILVYLLGRNERGLLELAESRLKIYDKTNDCPKFFNALAVCLAANLVKQAKIEHIGLLSVLERLLARTFERRHSAFVRYCGNNMYLQQVAVDTFLLPLARGGAVTSEGVGCLLSEFKRFQTREGFFYDLPRCGTQQEPLLPPTYIMKDLFLAGVCHELHPVEDIGHIIQSGMSAVLPFLNDEGSFSYFGRTDNSPFAAGLTIFNLRQAAKICPENKIEFLKICRRAEEYFMSFPRAESGLLLCNRFAKAHNNQELAYSKDDYAYVGEYSFSSCAYALLGCYWFPESNKKNTMFLKETEIVPSVVISKDLGLVKVNVPGRELILRIGSEITSWDRRYLGPTILRYKVGNSLYIGAISRTIGNDYKIKKNHKECRLKRAFNFFKYRFQQGWELLDGTSVGFLPVLRDGSYDYLPSQAFSIEASTNSVQTQHKMVRVRLRGLYPCLLEFQRLFRENIFRLKPRMYHRPVMKSVKAIEFSRDIRLGKDRVCIEDRVWGDLKGKTLLFSVRSFPQVHIELQGLKEVQSVTGWGSDGRQKLRIFEAKKLDYEFRYQCVIFTS